MTKNPYLLDDVDDWLPSAGERVATTLPVLACPLDLRAAEDDAAVLPGVSVSRGMRLGVVESETPYERDTVELN